ncbi:MAG: hypothetical protein A4E52_01193 [Pelotomaculum sp. PtaB.Bin013]|uniref:Uncharacterized protein n=1 Tax=Pelotomaculum isophthalicicum JI TaxID=947010 RepID=A0A9X4GXU2_9FIRM|nr:hypothetical protein [Pelotomaculum isophthalicicum]MDF9407160.1 hypothetical protein [Pelotomaculum isophthalicicum JI]OPX88687.1 MAG: hypothetical protein A4E52_01193 [Pelotomaculum sp. PtaB.Bin013]
MIKDIAEAMDIIKDTIDGLNQESMKAIVTEIKEIMDKAVDKLNNNSIAAASEPKKNNMQIIFSEINDIIKESVDKLNKEFEGKNINCCCPFIICFLLKDAECVNIYNGACETWAPGN